MTTVVIGKAEEEQAPPLSLPAQNSAEETEKIPEIRYFSAPKKAAHIPFRAVLFVQLLLSAAAGLFVYFGPEEIREAIRGLING